MPHRPPFHPLTPFLAVAFGIMIFGGMDAVMKVLALALGTYNALFWRSLVATACAGGLFALRPSPSPSGSTLRLHLTRGVIVSAMAFLFFWGLARTPMAEAIALSFIAPLIALYLAAVLLGEKIGRNSIIASVLGIGGVLVIVSGKLGQDFSRDAQWGLAAILASAVLYAYNLILQRRQAQIASPQEIALFQNGIVASVLLLFAPIYAVVPAAEYWPLIVLGALMALMSLLTISWGYARAEAQALVPIEYSAFIWAAILGWWIFDEPLGWETVAGTVLIVAGCLIVTYRRPKIAAPTEQAAL